MRWNTTDEFFIHAPPGAVQRMIMDLQTTSSWWPGARISGGREAIVVEAPCGEVGARVRFTARVSNVRPSEGLTWMLEHGELKGRAEWWLEPFKDGTIVHYYLDVERGTSGRFRRMSSSVRRHRWAIRRAVNALKDSLEAAARRAPA